MKSDSVFFQPPERSNQSCFSFFSTGFETFSSSSSISNTSGACSDCASFPDSCVAALSNETSNNSSSATDCFSSFCGSETCAIGCACLFASRSLRSRHSRRIRSANDSFFGPSSVTALIIGSEKIGFTVGTAVFSTSATGSAGDSSCFGSSTTGTASIFSSGSSVVSTISFTTNESISSEDSVDS